MNLQEDRRKIYNNFANLVSQVCNRYYFVSYLRCAKYKEKIDNNLLFWNMVYSDAQCKLLINLHEIFTEDEKNLNVCKLFKNIDSSEKDLRSKVEQEIEKNSELKGKLKEWRDKICAHKDNACIRDSSKIENKNPITIGFLESPIQNLVDILQITQYYFTKKEDRDFEKEFLENKREEIYKEVDNIFKKL
jgi:hypothetical protein